MRIFNKPIQFLALLLLAALNQSVMADTQCTMCHATSSSIVAHPITSSSEREAASGATAPGCISCHGESLTHLGNPMMASPDRPFSSDRSEHGTEWNNQCLGCHKKSARHWEASAHALEDITCNACHKVHESPKANMTLADRCDGCHKKVRQEFLLPSRHPLNENEVSCTDCHSPHGSLANSQLKEVTTNATCLNCHEAQRGPFLFDHPPASEDCLSCHKPHGAVHKPLLNSRGPQLCQQCHMANFHPSTLQAGGGLPENRPSASLLGRNCMNCHPKIHGSNHPSGARLTR
jgi:DmsE family decaheme c-type cytochrome